MTRTPDPENNPGLPLDRIRDAAIVSALAVYGLYAGSAFLIPLALAFLAYVLILAVADRVVDVLPLPVWFAHLSGIVLVLSGLLLIMYVLGSQATQLARAATTYEVAFDSALNRLAVLLGNDMTAFVRDSLVNVDMSRLARSAVGGATSFLNTFLMVSLYVGFMIAERRIFRHKLSLVAKDPALGQDINSVSGAISLSLQRYLGVKTLVSSVTAIISYLVFRWFGLEFAETWAVLTFVLNFIPSIGSIIAVIFPALVALVQFDTIAPFTVIVLFCGTVQFLIGNFLDPAMLGRSLNMSTFMVLIALTFWGTVWGIVGAFLSVPLTVCILIVFSHIPSLRPIAIMMSKDGTLSSGPEEPI
ncbi:MAG: AI-2E family transporter [Pseudomonadota bacterium]